LTWTDSKTCPILIFDGKKDFGSWRLNMKAFLMTSRLWDIVATNLEKLPINTQLIVKEKWEFEEEKYIEVHHYIYSTIV
jgi:hypothetical protein